MVAAQIENTPNGSAKEPLIPGLAVKAKRGRSHEHGTSHGESNGRRKLVAPEAALRAAVPSQRPELVVGIGASAGGLDAFKTFFANMPADSGMAFVLVQHLDPNFASSLVAIVGGYTTMPVHLAEDGATIDPNRVYVIPPDAILTVSGGILHLTRPAPLVARRTSINTFLASLARDQAESAVGIILSGFGHDGALGVAAIKEHGRLTLSQAEFDHHAKSGMPQSATSGGFVDYVLSVEDMPVALLEYQLHRKISDGAKGPDGVRQDLGSHLATICAVLHSRLGRDFSQYKPGTLMRRIQRRMHVLQTMRFSLTSSNCGAAARGGAVVSRTSHQRHSVLPRRGSVRGARSDGHTGTSRGYAQDRSDPGLGRRLRDG